MTGFELNKWELDKTSKVYELLVEHQDFPFLSMLISPTNMEDNPMSTIDWSFNLLVVHDKGRRDKSTVGPIELRIDKPGRPFGKTDKAFEMIMQQDQGKFDLFKSLFNYYKEY